MDRPPIRRGILVGAVALLVAFAGCSGLSGDTTPTAEQSENATASATPTPATATATPTPATATATPDDGASNPETPTDDSGTDDSGTDDSATDDSDSNLNANGTGADLDGEKLDNATRAAVEDAGSYTLQFDFRRVSRSERGQSRSRSTTTTRVDFDAGQGLRVSELGISSPQIERNRTTTVYTEGNTSYRERVTGDGTNYSTQEGEPSGFGGIDPVNTTDFPRNMTFVTDGLVWETNGTTTVDGETVTEYTLAGIEDQDTFTGGSGARLTDIGGTLYVDDDDVVRQFSLRYDVETDSSTSTIQARLALTDIGSTTVEEPDWVSEAEDGDPS